MTNETHTSGSTSRGRVDIAFYDAEAVTRTCPRWDDLSPEARQQALSYHAPDDHVSSANTTTVGLDQWRIDARSPSRPTPEPVSHIIVGTGTDETEHSDTSLTDPVDETPATGRDTEGAVCFINATFDQGQANADDQLSEIGVRTADGRLLNHATVPPRTKNYGAIMNVEVALVFEPGAPMY